MSSNPSLPIVNLIGLDSAGIFGGTATNISATGSFIADRVINNTKAPVGIFSEQQLFSLIAICRAIYESNSLAAGFVDSLINFIGEPRVKFISSTKDKETKESKIAQKFWDKFCANNSYGTFTAPSIEDERSTSREKEARRRWIRDGELWVRLKVEGDVIKARFIEPEQIRTPNFTIEGADNSWGVITDLEDDEKILGYAVINRYTKEFEFVDKEYVVSCITNSDRSIKRGLPDLAPAVVVLEKVIGIIRNMSHTAKAQSAIAWLEKWAYAGETQIRSIVESNSSQQTRDSSRLPIHEHPAGSVISTTNQREFEAGPVAEGADSFATVVAHCLKSIGWKWNYPDWFTGDAQSFASALVTGAPFVRYIESRQDDFKCFTAKLAGSVIYLAEKHGLLPEGIYRAVKPEVTMPMVVMADEAKQISTWKTELEMGVMDKKEWMIRRGREPRTVMKNIVKFAKIDSYIKSIGNSGEPQKERDGGELEKEPEPAPPGSRLVQESTGEYVYVRNKETGKTYSIKVSTLDNNPEKYEIVHRSSREGGGKNKDKDRGTKEGESQKEEPDDNTQGAANSGRGDAPKGADYPEAKGGQDQAAKGGQDEAAKGGQDEAAKGGQNEASKDGQKVEPKKKKKSVPAEKKIEMLREAAKNGDKAAQTKLAAISLYLRSTAGAKASAALRYSAEKIGQKLNFISPQEIVASGSKIASAEPKIEKVAPPINKDELDELKELLNEKEQEILPQQIDDINTKLVNRIEAQQYFADVTGIVEEFVNQREILDNRDGIVSSTVEELKELGIDEKDARRAVMATAKVNMLKRAGIVVSCLDDERLANLVVAGYGEASPFTRDPEIADANAKMESDKDFEDFLDDHFGKDANVLSYLKDNIVSADGTKTIGFHRILSQYSNLPREKAKELAQKLRPLAKAHALMTRRGQKLKALSEVGTEVLVERVTNGSTFPSANFPAFDSLAIKRDGEGDGFRLELQTTKRRVGKSSSHDALDPAKKRAGALIAARAEALTRDLAKLKKEELEQIALSGEREMRDRGFYGTRMTRLNWALAAGDPDKVKDNRLKREIENIDRELKCTLAKELAKMGEEDRQKLSNGNIKSQVVVAEMIEPISRFDETSSGLNLVYNANEDFCEYVATRERRGCVVLREVNGEHEVVVFENEEKKVYKVKDADSDEIRKKMKKLPTILKVASVDEIRGKPLVALRERAERLRKTADGLLS